MQLEVMVRSAYLILLATTGTQVIASETHQAAPRSDARCTSDQSELCHKALTLAQLLRASPPIAAKNLTITSSGPQATIIDTQVQPSPELALEKTTLWASQVQRSLCHVSLISDFVKQGGQLVYQLESNGKFITGVSIMCAAAGE